MSDVHIEIEPAAAGPLAASEGAAETILAVAPAAPVAPAVEATADAAVEIARIEAARDVDLAQIGADSAAETLADAAPAETELEQCLSRMETQADHQIAMAEQISSIRARLPADPPNPPSEAPDGLEPPASESASEFEPPPEPPKPRRKGLRWI